MTDLKSHHGTYIRRPGDSVSRSLVPEVPNVLADGDTITFGKAVGKEPDMVRPITVHVQLLFNKDIEPTPVSATASRETSSPKTSSGRYGVFLPPSDISSSSSSESDSDVEEIPPPAPHLATHGFEFSERVDDLFREASSMLRMPTDGASGVNAILRGRILPPISLLFTPTPEPPSFMPKVYEVEESDDSSDMEQSESSPDVEEVDAPLLSSPAPVSPVYEEPSGDCPPFVCRWLDSPERIASSSPAPAVQQGNASTHVSSAERAPAQSEDRVQPRDPAYDDDLYEDLDARNVWAERVSAFTMRLPERPRNDGDANTLTETLLRRAQAAMGTARQIVPPVTIPAEDAAPAAEQVCRLTIESRRSSHTFSRQEPAPMVEQPPVPAVVAESIGNDPVSVQTNADETVVDSEDVTMADDGPSEDATTLKYLRQGMYLPPALSFLQAEFTWAIAAMEEMRTQAQQDIEKELEALRAARAEAEAAAAQLRQEQREMQARLEAPILAPVSPILKRKRIEDEESAEDALRHVDVGVHVPPPIAPLPKRKRTMRVLSTVAHTTAVATLGAVAAWTALAYS